MKMASMTITTAVSANVSRRDAAMLFAGPTSGAVCST